MQLSHKARKPVSQTVIPSFSHLYTSLGLENKVLFNIKKSVIAVRLRLPMVVISLQVKFNLWCAFCFVVTLKTKQWMKSEDVHENRRAAGPCCCVGQSSAAAFSHVSLLMKWRHLVDSSLCELAARFACILFLMSLTFNRWPRYWSKCAGDKWNQGWKCSLKYGVGYALAE